jgi:hypothetical protein
VRRLQRIALARHFRRDDVAWERFYASPAFSKYVAEAVADIEAGRVLPLPATDEEWEALKNIPTTPINAKAWRP